MSFIGDSFLADGARNHFHEVPWTWVLHHPALPDDFDKFLANKSEGLVVISTPCLVGTIARFEAAHPHLQFAYVPENVRRDHPEDWETQTRFIVGTRDPASALLISHTLRPAITMSPESAEMVKHCLNGFLALSIEYAQKIATLSRRYGADPEDVSRGLTTDPRIGPRAYLRPEGSISPDLQRELNNLEALSCEF